MKEKFLLQDMQEHLKLYYFYTFLSQCFVDKIFQIEIILFSRLLVTFINLPNIPLLNCSEEFDERKTFDIVSVYLLIADIQHTSTLCLQYHEEQQYSL